MNKFDKFFFSKYVTDGTQIIEIAHKHILVILDKILFNYFLLVILPTFFYYNSDLLKSYIPFFILEIFIIIVFIINIYKIFDWYNDVWIITRDGVIELDRKIFSSDSVSLKYENIEGIEIKQDGFVDTILGKGEIIVNKMGGEENKFALTDASNAFQILEKIDKIQKQQTEEEEKGDDDENMDFVLKALSGVVEEYLGKSGYKKNDDTKEELIREIKEIDGTIDLTN